MPIDAIADSLGRATWGRLAAGGGPAGPPRLPTAGEYARGADRCADSLSSPVGGSPVDAPPAGPTHARTSPVSLAKRPYSGSGRSPRAPGVAARLAPELRRGRGARCAPSQPHSPAALLGFGAGVAACEIPVFAGFSACGAGLSGPRNEPGPDPVHKAGRQPRRTPVFLHAGAPIDDRTAPRPDPIRVNNPIHRHDVGDKR
jgi:hypothetical protein